MSVSRRYTSADLEKMPYDEWHRYEIVDGELFVSSAPSFGHQFVCVRAIRALDEWSEASGLGITGVAPGLVFTQDDDVIPDVVWVSWERFRSGTDAAGHLTIGPELVIEVLSPGSANTRRDREVKLGLYDRQGVDEYWIVDWQQRQVQVYRRADGHLQLAATLSGDATLETPLLPDFSLPIARLWPPAL